MKTDTVHVIVRKESGDQTSDPYTLVAATLLGRSYADKRRAEAAEEEFLAMIDEGASNPEDLNPDEFLAECGVVYEVIATAHLDTGF
jgi:TPP-dependent pyruvate/acetoin dehydrogenase alpha subunit